MLSARRPCVGPTSASSDHLPSGVLRDRIQPSNLQSACQVTASPTVRLLRTQDDCPRLTSGQTQYRIFHHLPFQAESPQGSTQGPCVPHRFPLQAARDIAHRMLKCALSNKLPSSFLRKPLFGVEHLSYLPLLRILLTAYGLLGWGTPFLSLARFF